MCIVGYGRIGRAVAELARAFGMHVLVAKRDSGASSLFSTGGEGQGEGADLETLFRTSDVISLHCPLTPETKHLVNAKRLAEMKSSAFLINTSRGPLIDEPALATALNADQIAGAGLDVLSVEPPLAENPLFDAKNCFITPHIAWATRAARSRLLETAVRNVEAFLKGKPVNI